MKAVVIASMKKMYSGVSHGTANRTRIAAPMLTRG